MAYFSLINVATFMGSGFHCLRSFSFLNSRTRIVLVCAEEPQGLHSSFTASLMHPTAQKHQGRHCPHTKSRPLFHVPPERLRVHTDPPTERKALPKGPVYTLCDAGSLVWSGVVTYRGVRYSRPTKPLANCFVPQKQGGVPWSLLYNDAD